MFQSMLQCNARTNKELKKIIDEKALYISNYHKKAEQSILMKMINLILKDKNQGWQIKLEELMKNEEYQEEKSLDDSLILLGKLLAINNENAENNYILYNTSSLDEIWEIYQKTIFYLRRIEFDFEDKDFIGFLDLLEKWKFSVEYLIMVISEGAIYNKTKTSCKLCNILSEQEYFEYADKIALYFKLKIQN